MDKKVTPTVQLDPDGRILAVLEIGGYSNVPKSNPNPTTSGVPLKPARPVTLDGFDGTMLKLYRNRIGEMTSAEALELALGAERFCEDCGVDDPAYTYFAEQKSTLFKYAVLLEKEEVLNKKWFENLSRQLNEKENPNATE